MKRATLPGLRRSWMLVVGVVLLVGPACSGKGPAVSSASDTRPQAEVSGQQVTFSPDSEQLPSDEVDALLGSFNSQWGECLSASGIELESEPVMLSATPGVDLGQAEPALFIELSVAGLRFSGAGSWIIDLSELPYPDAPGCGRADDESRRFTLEDE